MLRKLASGASLLVVAVVAVVAVILAFSAACDAPVLPAFPDDASGGGDTAPSHGAASSDGGEGGAGRPDASLDGSRLGPADGASPNDSGGSAITDAGNAGSPDATLDGSPPAVDSGGGGGVDGASVDAASVEAGSTSVDAGGGTGGCTGAVTDMICGTACVDIASSTQNCRVCGHDCGAGSSCQSGVCQPVMIYGQANPTTFAVDGSGVYFTTSSGIETCPLTGCALSPTVVSTSTGPLLLANGYFTAYTALEPVGENITLCPVSGCTSSNQIPLASDNRTVSVIGPIASPSDFFFGLAGGIPQGPFLSGCLDPSGSACAQTVAISSDTSGGPLVASDAFVYFNASFEGGATEVYSCPVDAADCAPTPMNLPSYSQIFAYFSDLYVLLPVSGPTQTIGKCPSTGCGAGVTPVVGAPYGIGTIAVDATGIYWTNGSTLEMCPLTGCVGGPVDVAVNQTNPASLELSGGFVYWTAGGSNTILRVAEPAP